MTRNLLTPTVQTATRDLARGLVFRKQILPVTKIGYEGETLTFDEKYMQDLVDAFNDAAYDQVPFTLATDDNRHTDDPERIRGEVTSISLATSTEEPGLYATISFPNTQAATAIVNNPKLGVSCRILEGLEKSDGRTYAKALKHVCGTPDPRVTGMSPWQKVDLSGYDGQVEVIDLSTKDYTEAQMPKPQGSTTTSSTTTSPKDLTELTDEELTQLADIFGIDASEVAAFLDVDDPDDATGEPTAAATGTSTLVGAGAATNLSTVGGNLVDLTARDIATSARQAADEALTTMASTAWSLRRNALVGAGVPPYLVDLCEPVFNRPHGMVIDLSNGEGSDTFDVQGLVGKLLDGMSGYVDLANETGHGGQFQQNSAEVDPDEAALKQWDRDYPIR